MKNISIRNRKCAIRNDNATGYKGVSYNKAKRKYVAFIRQHGKQCYLGGFDTPKEASKAYKREFKKIMKNG